MVIVLNIIRFIVLVLVTYFTCQIITDNKKRISYIGVLLICFSSTIIEYINSGLIDIVIFGELIFISINTILKKRKCAFIGLLIVCIFGLLLSGYEIYKYNSVTNIYAAMSIYPIGLLIGIFYIFKEETKHSKFMIPTVLISFLELILIIANINIVFLPKYILIFAFNLLQNYMIVYIFSQIEEKLFSLTSSAYITLLALLVYMFVPVVPGTTKITLNLSYVIFVLKTYIILNYSDKRFWRLASWVFTVICLFDFASCLIVNFM